MAPSAPTVGVVGLGYGRAHIPAFQAHGCPVVAVCQRDRAAAEKVAARYGVPRVFERWQDLLAEARPEIVVVATPPHLHRAIALAAFAAGAHVLCEKPLAMDDAEARDMVAAAARHGRIGMTAFNWRFPAAMQRFHALVAEGVLGRVFHASVQWLGGRMADETAPATWRVDRAVAGHGAMGDMGVHVIDLVRWNLGEVARVAARAGIAHPARAVPGGGRPGDAEDYCSILAELASGAHVTMVASRAARGRSRHALEVFGARTALAYRLDRELPAWHLGELSAITKSRLEPVPVEGPPAPAGIDPVDLLGTATIGPLVERMLEAIRTGTPASPSFEDGRRAQLVLDAVLAASRDGRWVEVPA